MKALQIAGRRTAVVAAAAATVAAGLAFLPVTTAQAQATACLTVDSQVTEWSVSPDSGGFAHHLTLTNTCAAPVNGWTLRLTLPPGQTVVQSWSVIAQILDDRVTFTPSSWNTVISPGASTHFGFIGTWLGTYQDPLSCTVDGFPCGGDVANEPPVVTLTGPEDGTAVVSVCPVRLTADASDPDGSVDRVEFYVNGTLVGTDTQAPYGVDLASNDPVLSTIDNTAFARVFDDGSPALSTDSAVVTFTRPVPPPVLQLIACTPAIEVEEGGSATAIFSSGACPFGTQVDVTVDGDPGITVTPTSYVPSFDGFGDQVTVSAAPGTAGATATVTATATGAGGTSCVRGIPVTVVGGGSGGNQPPEVVQTSPVGLVGLISPCGLTFAAEASDPDGSVDRVEFYVNGVLVGTDDTAPYRVRSSTYPTPAPPSTSNVAFARAYDDGVPELSTDSEPVAFQVAAGDLPPGVLFPCESSLTLRAGSSEEIWFALRPSTPLDQLTLTVTGDPGVTVTSPATPVVSGFRATVSAAAGSAGATATITATIGDVAPVTMSITVVAPS